MTANEDYTRASVIRCAQSALISGSVGIGPAMSAAALARPRV
jgi:hypothetical protein